MLFLILINLTMHLSQQEKSIKKVIKLMVFKIEYLDSRKHIRFNFCCGKDSLDNYIRKQASQDVKRRVSTVFVLIDQAEYEVLAYYTLFSYTRPLAIFIP